MKALKSGCFGLWVSFRAHLISSHRWQLFRASALEYNLFTWALV